MHNLTADSPWSIHTFRTVFILVLSISLLPLSALVTATALLLRAADIIRVPRDQIIRHDNPNPPRILITGVKMAKGLFLARTMHLRGCTVFGADFAAHFDSGAFYSGRFSAALKKFYALKDPATHGVDGYIQEVLSVIQKEGIDVWISCSKAATAGDDAKLAAAIEERTKCKVFQLDGELIEVLNDKIGFMRRTSELGLPSLQWWELDSKKEISRVIADMGKDDKKSTRYVIKSASDDASTRGALPLLNSRDLMKARLILENLDFSSGRQWIIQEFIEGGQEYCTHAVVVNGNIRAFTACPSESVLMHYERLDPNSILFAKMLEFTEKYAKGLGNITGHLSFDFLIRYNATEDGFCGALAPIECNPRCHTATVLFEGVESELADTYLEILTGAQSTPVLQPQISTHVGMYWMAHDLVVLFFGSIFELLLGSKTMTSPESIEQIQLCIRHLLTWRDPTFLWWDPLPWFVLNHIFWPWELILAITSGTKWRQLNVSTAKVFKA